MAKKELIRKVLATALTVLTLSCGLGICIWLLFSSSMFGAALRWTMLLCSVVLAGAIVGLLVSKIQEIKALAEIVRLDAQRPAQPEVQAQAPSAEPAAPPAPAERPAQPEEEKKGGEPPVRPANAVPLTVAPGVPAQEAPAEHKPWRPINFSAVDSAAKAQLAKRQKELEAAEAAEAQRRQAEEAAARAEEERRAQEQAEQLRLAEEARRQAQADAARAAQEEQARQAAAQEAKKAAMLAQAKRNEEARRAEQLRLADAARTGQIPQITDQLIAAEEARLAELARKAEAERLAKLRQTGAFPAQKAAAAPVPPKAARVQAPANPTPAQPVWQAVAFDRPAPTAGPLQVEVPKPPEEEPHKLSVKPIAWPAPPPPSKVYVTGAIPKVTPEMVAAEQAQQASSAGSWQKSN